jgi:hypothetical protein
VFQRFDAIWKVFQERAKPYAAVKLSLLLPKRYGVKTYGKAVPYLRRLVAGSGHVGFVVNKAALE